MMIVTKINSVEGILTDNKEFANVKNLNNTLTNTYKA